MNGRLRLVPDDREQAVLDWLAEIESGTARPLLDEVVGRLTGIRQVRPWPWQRALDALRPEPVGSPRRAAWIIGMAAALLVASLGLGLFAVGQGQPQPSLGPTPGPTAAPSSFPPSTAPSIAPSASAGRQAFPLADLAVAIAYATGDTGPLSVIATDGTGRRQLGSDIAGHLVQPDWSTAGDRLLALDQVQDSEQVWEIDPTGRQPSLVILPCTSPCDAREEASYSRDAGRIAFFEASGPLVKDIPTTCGVRIYTRSTQAITTLTSSPCGRTEEREPRFSPDGTRVAFWRTHAPGDQPTTAITESALFVRDLKTGRETRLTDWSLLASSLDWSPDGTWIAFATHWWDLQVGDADVWRVHPDGSGLERMTTIATPGVGTFRPRYTPDGAWILFSRFNGPTGELWAIPANGGLPVPVLPGIVGGYHFEPGPALPSSP